MYIIAENIRNISSRSIMAEYRNNNRYNEERREKKKKKATNQKHRKRHRKRKKRRQRNRINAYHSIKRIINVRAWQWQIMASIKRNHRVTWQTGGQRRHIIAARITIMKAKNLVCKQHACGRRKAGNGERRKKAKRKQRNGGVCESGVTMTAENKLIIMTVTVVMWRINDMYNVDIVYNGSVNDGEEKKAARK